MEEKSSEKPITRWEANVSTRVAKASPDQIWPLLKDFFNIHKWFPDLSACHGIHGVNGEVGCIRYVIMGAAKQEDDDNDRPVIWAKERLIDMDHVNKSLSYEFVDSHSGIKSYAATFKVMNPRSGEGEDGCVIEWSFGVDPIQRLRLEDLVSLYQNWLNIFAKNMEDYVLAEEESSVIAAKWEGKASVKLKGTADQIWSLLADFANFDKFAGMTACHKVEGEDGQPGLVRYCNFGSIEEPKFTHEKLLSMDPVERCYSYTITENNLGFTGHLATWKVVPIHVQDDDPEQNESEIVWSYVLDPVEGFTSETYMGFCQSGLLAMKGKLEEAVV